ncbi:MAG: hypothetical protein SGPRY_010600 [Prymnesium sp.]
MACPSVVEALSGRLHFAGSPLFLNGVNLAWLSYHADTNASLARGEGLTTFCGWEEAIRFTVRNGGNSLRVWLLQDPASALRLHEGGVRGLKQGVIRVAKTLLELAANYNVFVVLTLFNGAAGSERDCALFSEAGALNELIETVIHPLALALRSYNSLAMWEVINEPEGMLDLNQIKSAAVRAAASECAGDYDRAGWNKACQLSPSQLLRFINRVAAALREADGRHLITVGAWHACTSSNGPVGSLNLFSSARLREAGGMQQGFLDVFQVHSYPKEKGGSAFGNGSPTLTNVAAYGIGSPVIIGEISNRWIVQPASEMADATAEHSELGTTMADLYASALARGYAGIFGWAYNCDPKHDDGCVGRESLAHALRRAAQRLPGEVVPRPRVRNMRCDCPSRGNRVWSYTCHEQAEWGKCLEPRVAEVCTSWCSNCGEPLDAPPETPTCLEWSFGSFVTDGFEAGHECVARAKGTWSFGAHQISGDESASSAIVHQCNSTTDRRQVQHIVNADESIDQL